MQCLLQLLREIYIDIIEPCRASVSFLFFQYFVINKNNNNNNCFANSFGNFEVKVRRNQPRHT